MPRLSPKSRTRIFGAAGAAMALACAVAACSTGTPRAGTPAAFAPPPSSALALAASAMELTVGASGGDSLDLAALGRLVGDARVVTLGEPWHGDGGAIARRTQLVRYLHEQKGFDVLVFEADFYALHEAWREARRTGELRAVMDQVFPFWTDTRAARPLWDYLAARMRAGDTLAVAGVDVQLLGPRSRADLPALVAARYAALPGADPAVGQAAAATLDAALSPSAATRALLTRERLRDLLDVVRQLERAAEDRVADVARLPAGAARAATEADVFWAQTASTLRRSVVGERRDLGMGANFLWLATQQYPGRKLILWAHNDHLIADKWMLQDGPDSTVMGKRTRTDAARASTAYLGDEVRRAFGRRAVAIATIVYEGRYSPDIEPALGPIGIATANFDSTVTLAPAAPGTVEAALADAGRRVALVDLRPFAGGPPVLSRVLDYTQLPPLRLALWRGFDALLFVRTTMGLNDRKMPPLAPVP